jgi:hypothetical protein
MRLPKALLVLSLLQLGLARDEVCELNNLLASLTALQLTEEDIYLVD